LSKLVESTHSAHFISFHLNRGQSTLQTDGKLLHV